MHSWNTRKKIENGEEIFKIIMSDNFPKLFTKPQIQASQRLPRSVQLGISYSNDSKAKTKKKLQEVKGGKHFT